MHRLLTFASAVALAILPATADWLEWRGSPLRDGIWRDISLPAVIPSGGFPTAWKATLGQGYSGPSVAGNRVYVMDRLKPPLAEVDTERVVCLDAQDGHFLWTNAYPCAVHYPYGYENGPRNTPLIEGNSVYTLGGMGTLSSLDAVSGSIRWRHDLAAEYHAHIPNWGVSSQPLLVGDSLVVMVGNTNDACVVAFDKGTGKEHWRSLSERPSYVPLLSIPNGSGRSAIVWTADGVHGLDTQTGAEQWGFPFRCKYDEAVHTPLFDGTKHRLYFPHDWSGTLVVQLDSDHQHATLVGTNRNLSMLHSAAVLLDGVIYAVNHNSGDAPAQGELRALDVKSGELLWKTNAVTPMKRWAQAAITYNEGNHCAYILNDQGELILARLTRSGYEELGRSQISGKTWSHPAFSNGCVYVRSETSLICAKLK
ncbi:MAG TPA: PQQ-binding-like beta-propeller repeat protein [Candidatus Limnocylindria bacterium]|jgi:outer membrane protein assembly factor BamB|nr:PQQ-binding-like beta-propeller repeat protein [Candidatus Limnocylindria bacterium]